MTKLAKVVCDIKSVLSDGDIRDLRAACKKTNSLGRKTKILKKKQQQLLLTARPLCPRHGPENSMYVIPASFDNLSR